MSISEYKDGYRVYVRNDKGIMKSKVFRGANAKTDALAYEMEHNLAKVRKKAGDLGVKQKITWDEIADSVLADRKVRGSSDSYLRILENFYYNQVIPFFRKKRPDEVTHPDVVRFIASMSAKSQITRNRYVAYLKILFNYALENGMVSANPVHIKQKREKARKVFLTREDLGKIMENAVPHLAWAIECAWEMGCRPGYSELLALQWRDIDFEKCRVNIPGTKTRASDRVVPITPDFLERLRAMREVAETEYVIEFFGRKIENLAKAWRNAVIRAGITYRTRMYDIRHLYATDILTQGGDLAGVAALLGHTSTKMTADQYYHVLEGEKERSVSVKSKLKGKKVEVKRRPSNQPRVKDENVTH